SYQATAPPNGELYTGLAVDPTDGSVYASSRSGSSSSLMSIDVSTGEAVLIGPITEALNIIAIAVDGSGTLYGYDIFFDNLLTIDKSTGAGTVIGDIGFDANFGQGLGWDPETDTLYMAAYNDDANQAELRVVNRADGSTALAGVMGASVPGGLNQYTWLGFDLGDFCIPVDLAWLSASPTSGSIQPEGEQIVEAIIDSSGLTAANYEGALCIQSNDYNRTLVRIPVTLEVREFVYAPMLRH
ncbi:MAG: hypothetical protein ACK2T3_10885, partial [Candidatus Promineifilaceae bacterium]